MVELLAENPERAKSQERTTPKRASLAAILRGINRQKILSGRIASHAYWWLPTLITLLVLRFRAGRPVLGEDESITWDASIRSIRELKALASNTDAVIAPYYFFMHFWIRLFGDSEVALRAPSILAVAAAVGMAAMLARRLFSPKVGMLTGILLVLIPAITRYGQEARPYGFAILFGTGATLLLFCALDRPSWWRWFGYGLSIMLLGLFQLLGLLLLLGHATALAFRFWEENRGRSIIRDSDINWRPYLCWMLATIGGLLPIIPVALAGFTQQKSQLWWIPPMKWDAFQNLPNDLFWSPAIGWSLVGIVLFFLAGNSFSFYGYNRTKVYQLGAIAIMPSVSLYIMSFVSPSWVPRYVIYTVIPWCLLAAAAAATTRWRTIVVFVLVAIIGIPTYSYLRLPISHDQPDYRAAMRVISENYRAGDTMVYEPREAWKVRPEVRYYLRKDRPRDVLAVSSSKQNNSFHTYECQKPRSCLRGISRVWVFRPSKHDSALDDYVDLTPETLRQDYFVDKTWHPGTSTVALYVRKALP
ncbi:MAG: hypothetical protein DLM55_02480 [Acidimicrobiales bacterium]|nr:MAG: hypothetical protein DLM55_02480 [Acidimicrobiales bacterium]